MLQPRAPLPSIPNKAAYSWRICSPPGSMANPREKPPWRLSMNPKIAEHHRSRSAYVYLRQSTPGQVLHHQESTERQYALREKAEELGWSQASIRTLDADLGKSGTQTAGREDFKTLVADVSMGQVGAVLALEASRLSRSDLDWHRLLELCALTQTLVIDEDGCYDPADFNDGLLLGLKGTMAQAELHFCACASRAVSSTKPRRESCVSLCRLDFAMMSKATSFWIPMKKCAVRWPSCFACFAKPAAPLPWCNASPKADYDFPSEPMAEPGRAG